MITHRKMTEEWRRKEAHQNDCNLTFCHHQIRHNISLLSFFSFYHPSFSTLMISTTNAWRSPNAWEMQMPGADEEIWWDDEGFDTKMYRRLRKQQPNPHWFSSWRNRSFLIHATAFFVCYVFVVARTVSFIIIIIFVLTGLITCKLERVINVSQVLRRREWLWRWRLCFHGCYLQLVVMFWECICVNK